MIFERRSDGNTNRVADNFPRNPTYGSGWIFEARPTRRDVEPSANPNHGSGWIIQTRPTSEKGGRAEWTLLPHFCRLNLNDPHTAVWGITDSSHNLCRGLPWVGLRSTTYS